MSRKRFELEIIGHCVTFYVAATEPFEGAAFVVHRPNAQSLGRCFLVTHRNTTMIVASSDRFADALNTADRYSRQCPSAKAVKLKHDANGNPLAGHASGPWRKLKRELSALGAGL